MFAAIVIVTSLYAIFSLCLSIGWTRAFGKKRQDRNVDVMNDFISVVVPVRNEQLTLGHLLRALREQNYPHFEVIVVDDHSSDGSFDIASTFGDPVLVFSNKSEGKKHAISTGVSKAKGSLIVTTDGDCVIHKEWLRTVSRFFFDQRIQMLVGPVSMEENGFFFTRLQQMEFASLIGSGAATLSLGFPTLCNGANLAFRKSAFEKVNGYEGNFHVASGDDEFLMRKIHQKYKNGITFMAASEGIVETRAQPDLKSFFQQRLRWASKWRHNSSRAAVTLAFFVAAVQIATLGCVFGFFISGKILWLVFPLAKIVMDAGLLARFFRFLKIPWHLPAFLILELLYPFYVIVTAIVATFRSYQWKGRRY